MKLVTFQHPHRREPRLGIVYGEYVIDGNMAFAVLLNEEGEEDPEVLADALLPSSMISFLRRGRKAFEAAEKVLFKARSFINMSYGEGLVYELGKVRLHAPIPRPGKIIHTAGNFREHAKEAEKAKWEFPIPQWISFLKSPTAVIGPYDNIVYPKYTKELDYELEMAIVIGKRGKYIPKERAFDYVAGFMVFNDITARDIQRQEMKNGLLNFGKNLDTFAPLGPYLVTKDEVSNPHNLKMELRVNGEVRQSGNTNRLSVTLQEIIEHYSWVMLEPGDIITTGTISGVAAFRENPEKYYLKPGDVVESEIESLGVMRNPVVAE
ncbi:fumarylacetoacetate hydrolase family protein [Candidatus Caldarchaeum subterraneum]|mgnify:CR=1 FL=1|uniref:Fumarylacetoacetate hydrolase family protein n=1 Tax=Caldiarchaeum subterraneum TaxID=311458 RepID=E6N4T9_CALS0|nr:fumarylacetoacetate hydrolase family protein [Candidatus Caldarchaeum subterraneum]BAJ50110.1 fumarylacetoacetate hydrolase family protein [Candidatus Caldarchaeum subterraneum]